MNKFLELAFVNKVRNDDDFTRKIDECYEPVLEALRERLSEKACSEIEDILSDCQNEAMYLAGVSGMELAIGVMNGTIKQTIEL